MEVHARTIEFKDKLTLIPLGDIHWGARACAERKVDTLLDWALNKEDCYILGMGDYIDGIVRQDLRRFSGTCTKDDFLNMLDDALNEQTHLAVRKLKPLADAGKILGLLKGNHEYSMQRDHSYNIHREICERLQVPDLGFSCFYRLAVRRDRHKNKTRSNNVMIYAHHGWSAGRKSGSSVNKLEDAVAHYKADIYLMGHDHNKFGKRHIVQECTTNGQPRIRHKPVILARTGTFLKTCQVGDTTYAERFGYPPTDLGVVKITITVGGQHHETDLHISE